ncbi:SRPBCC family protein, partial [Nonomuraea zeae]
MNENLTIHPDGRTTLRMQRRLPHPQAKVWRAITQPEHLAHWFPADVTIDGDRITYGFGPQGRITELDPPHVFAHTWGDDELRWELHPDGEATILTLTHTFTDLHGAASFAAGWHTCVLALLAHLDERPARRPTGT